jgi:hypothetical protein
LPPINPLLFGFTSSLIEGLQLAERTRKADEAREEAEAREDAELQARLA